MKKKPLVVYLLFLLFLGNSPVVMSDNLTEPIVLPTQNGGGAADPWVIYKDGYYYYCKSQRLKGIVVSKSKRLQDIALMPLVTVWTPPTGTMHSKEIWAPELHFLNGKWYIYFAADDGKNVNHRMYVLESSNPQSGFEFKGKVAAPDDKWAIDGSVLQKNDGSLYFIWSGCEKNADFPQNIYIAPMSDPMTICGEKVLISTPVYDWEKRGAALNEGPTILKRNGKIHLIFSASGSWTDNYCLGRITNSDGDVLNPNSWYKQDTPLFSTIPTSYGPGHASFTKSPDGSEDWIVYHACKMSGQGWTSRSVRTQKFMWNNDDSPNFGTPYAFDAVITEPSSTPSSEGILSGNQYKLIVLCSRKCLAVSNDSIQSEQNIQQWTNNSSDSQTWRIDKIDGCYYKLTAKNNNLCLEANKSAAGSKAHVKQSAYSGKKTQQWKIEYAGNGFYKLISLSNGLSLNVTGGSTVDGANIQLENFNGNSSQLWKIEYMGGSNIGNNQ